jgi:Nuclease-related domain
MPRYDQNVHGVPGGSAATRAAAIRALRERQATTRSGKARFLRALVGPTESERRSIESERRWSSGAEGERMLAHELARRCPDVALLHDVCPPGRRGNIDHIAIAPSGVYVIDAKRYRGTIRVVSPLFREPKLIIANRDRTRLVEGLERQVGAVRAALDRHGATDIAVTGCLCFVPPAGGREVGLPAIRTLRIAGHPLYSARRLCRQLNRPGPIEPAAARELRALLARCLRPAV